MNMHLLCMAFRGIIATAEQRAGVRALNATIVCSMGTGRMECRWINQNTGKRQSVTMFTFDLEDKNNAGFEDQITTAVEYLQSGIGAEVSTA